MEYQTLIVDLKDNIGCIRLNRPDVMNALNTQMRAEIADAVTRIASQVRVVVLTGTGRAFCSGQDLGDRSNAAQVDMERTLRDEYEPMLRAITDCPVPTITELNGAAAGAGAYQHAEAKEAERKSSGGEPLKEDAYADGKLITDEDIDRFATNVEAQISTVTGIDPHVHKPFWDYFS